MFVYSTDKCIGRGGSPNRTATDSDGPEIPAISDSPNSSAPSTPNDDAHKRVGGVAIGNEDYFVTALKLRQDGAGSTTPRQAMKRNATFSPRIVFHDTWPSQEYDRRGEVATCNRLTPLLAQQIKEELNSFKMVGFLLPVLGLVCKEVSGWVRGYDMTNRLYRRWKFTKTPKSTRTFSSAASSGGGGSCAVAGGYRLPD